MRKRLKLLPVLTACVLLQGCVGIGWWTRDSTSINKPFISDRADLEGVGKSHNTFEYTGPWLHSHWGSPTSIRPASGLAGGEVWSYEFKRCWCGLIPMAIVPIPLVLPAGHEKVVFLVREGRVVNAKRVQCRHGGFGIGLVGPEGPWAGGGF